MFLCSYLEGLLKAIFISYHNSLFGAFHERKRINKQRRITKKVFFLNKIMQPQRKNILGIMAISQKTDNSGTNMHKKEMNRALIECEWLVSASTNK